MGSLLALAGCGGDGDSGSDVASTPLTKDNAAKASAVVVEASGALFDLASSTDVATGVVLSATSGSSGRGSGLASFTARHLKAASQRPLPNASGAVGAVAEETLQCTGGGTVAVRYDDADNNEEDSAGDSLRLTFASCIEEGITSNGVVSARLTRVASNSFGAQATFDNLTLNDGTDAVSANGGFEFEATDLGGGAKKLEITGERLTGTVNSNQISLSGFAASYATDALGTATYTFNGRVSDSGRNITVDARTPIAFVARATDNYPFSGKLSVTGAGNSQAVLEVVSSSIVRISADPEGDGSFTTPVEMTWIELESLLD